MTTAGDPVTKRMLCPGINGMDLPAEGALPVGAALEGERASYRRHQPRAGDGVVVLVLGPWEKIIMTNDDPITNEILYRTTGSLFTGAVSSGDRCARRTLVPQKHMTAWLV